MTDLRVWHDPPPERIGRSALELLENLGGAGAVHVRGEDASRTRAVVTLLHGNEPSGVRAMHAWLSRRIVPRVSCVWIVGAVEAALAPPPFSHRQRPGGRDLNRCFRAPFDEKEGAVASAILRLLAQSRPEAVIDLHNNTGHNPPYGISTRADATHLGLTAWFARRFVASDLSLGALVEAAEHEVPSVTIECGRAGDPDADVLALRGIADFLASEALAPVPCPPVEVFERPTRVTLRSGATVAIDRKPKPDADLTLDPDIDRHNWRTLDAGAVVGRAPRGDALPLQARRPDGTDVTAELFVLDAGVVRTRRPLIPIMITTDPEIAKSDCLFYVVRRAAVSQSFVPL